MGYMMRLRQREPIEAPDLEPYVRSFRVGNFKCFDGEHRIPLKPITLLFGPNSAGKSSLLQMLAILKQTLQESSASGIQLLPNGKLTQAGVFRDYVIRHDEARRVSFTLDLGCLAPFSDISEDRVSLKFLIDAVPGCSSPGDLYAIEIYLGEEPSPALVFKRPADAVDGSSLNLEAVPGFTDMPLLELTEIRLPMDSWERKWKFARRLSSEFSEEYRRDPAQTILEELLADKDKLEEGLWIARACSILGEMLFQEDARSSEIAEKLYNVAAELNDGLTKRSFEQAITDSLKDRLYLALDRFLPSHFLLRRKSALYEDTEYLELPLKRFDDMVPDDDHVRARSHIVFQTPLHSLILLLSEVVAHFFHELSFLGSLRPAPERFYADAGQAMSTTGLAGSYFSRAVYQDPELVEALNKRLEPLTGYRLGTQDLGHGIYRIVLTDKSGTDATLADVGFGISQIFPVVAHSFACRNETIVIEQPELHLHPRMQADVADLIIESCQRLRNTFVIETHSEHLMLRLRKRIREGTLDPKHVAVLYVQPPPESPQILEIGLDNEGDFIDAWPNGFFEEDFREIFS